MLNIPLSHLLYFGTLNQYDLNGKRKSTPFKLACSICHGKVSRQNLKKVLWGISAERLIIISKNCIALFLVCFSFLPNTKKKSLSRRFPLHLHAERSLLTKTSSYYLQLLTEFHMGIHQLFLLSISSIYIIWRHRSHSVRVVLYFYWESHLKTHITRKIFTFFKNIEGTIQRELETQLYCMIWYAC